MATNETTVFHYGGLIEGQQVVTGQPELFLFPTKQLLIDKLKTYNQEYKEPEILKTNGTNT
ncbi:hypothetical protein [Aurantibacillus circumpalustris]|uniref:hypothetical protein n=1 Tax=Aurantibacillus circumpalustris TaxID=3036359 RepID=UPI00295A7F49|nr:hypothetical protein [Aurantibacillus circumpalustris]